MRFSKSAIQVATSGGGDASFLNVAWLMPFDGTNGATTSPDESPNNLTPTFTSCSLTTSGSKWGTACLSTSGSSHVTASLPAVGTGQFILEGWFYWTATGSTQVLWDVSGYASADGYELYILSGGSINVYGGGGTFQINSAAGAITAGAWHHIALKRNAANLVSIWVNGASVASGTWAASLGGDITLANWGPSPSTSGHVGKIDDFRATHGTDRGATVTVPSAAFPTSASPTVYSKWNPLDKSANATLSVSDHVATTATASNVPVRALYPKSHGKYYAEIQGGNLIGISTSALAMVDGNYPGAAAASYGYHRDGTKYTSGANSAYGTAWSQSAIISVVLDMDAGTLVFWKDGVPQGTAYTGLSGTYFLTVAMFASGIAPTSTINAGDSAFVYTPPVGHVGFRV